MHFLKFSWQIPFDLREFKNLWLTESPYIHKVSACVTEFPFPVAVSISGNEKKNKWDKGRSVVKIYKLITYFDRTKSKKMKKKKRMTIFYRIYFNALPFHVSRKINFVGKQTCYVRQPLSVNPSTESILHKGTLNPTTFCQMFWVWGDCQSTNVRKSLTFLKIFN